MRKYACRQNSLLIIQQRFSIICSDIAAAKVQIAATGVATILVFPVLRSKKIFILNELAAVHSL
jgi:hypothetical protein